MASVSSATSSKEPIELCDAISVRECRDSESDSVDIVLGDWQSTADAELEVVDLRLAIPGL